MLSLKSLTNPQKEANAAKCSRGTGSSQHIEVVMKICADVTCSGEICPLLELHILRDVLSPLEA